MCHAEIGVFETEHGHKQRLKFNIFLTVDYGNMSRADNLSDVLSYEIILEAINRSLSGKRLNLLETLADNVATFCLEYNEVTSVEIQIEKMDRIDGSLGVRLVRKKE